MPEDDKLYALFAESCLEQLHGIEAAILDLETAGPDTFGAKVGAIFRAAHTIKGDAGAVGASSLASLAHAAESVLDAVREGVLAISRPLIGELLAVFDVIKGMVEDAGAAAARDVSPEIARLAALLEAPKAAVEATPVIGTAAEVGDTPEGGGGAMANASATCPFRPGNSTSWWTGWGNSALPRRVWPACPTSDVIWNCATWPRRSSG